VLLFCLCEDQNVIQVHYYDPFGYESSEDIVHHSLEGGGTVGHSEEHHEGFEEATVLRHWRIFCGNVAWDTLYTPGFHYWNLL